MSNMLNLILTNGLTLPDKETFIDKIFPNIWAFLVQLIAFIFMVLIVIYFAYKPVKKFLATRREYVKNNLESASRNNAEAIELNRAAKENVLQAKKEAVNIVEQAKKEALNERALAVEETKREIANKKLQAQEDIAKEKEKALKEAHDEIVDLALVASSELLKREVSTKDNTKLVDDFVKNLEENK